MATSAKAGSFTLRDTAGSQSVTGLGFTPKAVIFWAAYTGIPSGNNEYRTTFGCATSSTARWSSTAYHNQAGRTTGCEFNSDRCFRLTEGGADSSVASADFTTMDSDGFTINVSTALAITIHYFAIGGTSVSAKAGTFTCTEADGPVVVGSVGFNPKAVIFGFGPANTTGAPASDAMLGVGWATATAQGASNFYNEITTDGTNSYDMQNTSYCMSRIDPFGNENLLNTCTMGTGEFTVNVTNFSPGDFTTGYLALGGSAVYALHSFNEPTSTGVREYTSLGVSPNGIMFMTNGNAASNGIGASTRRSIGAASSSTANAVAGLNNPVTATNTAALPVTFNSTAACIGTCSTTNDSTTALASLSSFGTDKFTLDWSKVSGAGSQVIVFMLGEIDVDVVSVRAAGGVGSVAVAGKASTVLTGVAGTAALGTVTATGMTGSVGVNVSAPSLVATTTLGSTFQIASGSVVLTGVAGTTALGAVRHTEIITVRFEPLQGMQMSTPSRRTITTSRFGIVGDLEPDHPTTASDPDQPTRWRDVFPPRGI